MNKQERLLKERNLALALKMELIDWFQYLEAFRKLQE
jgi:hypothetical protein